MDEYAIEIALLSQLVGRLEYSGLERLWLAAVHTEGVYVSRSTDGLWSLGDFLVGLRPDTTYLPLGELIANLRDPDERKRLGLPPLEEKD